MARLLGHRMRDSIVSARRLLCLIAGISLILGGGFLLLHRPGGVTVSWETASEVGAMGFNLYRAEGSVEGTFERINDELIPAQGDPLTGAAYHTVDRSVKPGSLYFYQIEEVEWSGVRHRHPDVVQVRAGVPRSWLTAEGLILILLGCGLLYLQTRRERDSNREPVGTA